MSHFTSTTGPGPGPIEPPRPVVLMTGAAGRLTQAVRPYLQPHCAQLRLTDRVALDAHTGRAAPMAVAELADIGQHPGLLAGVDAIVHFAGTPRESDWETLLPSNVLGVARLWEAAHRHGVRRIIYASSNHAVGFHPRSARIGPDAPPRPDSRYGVTKVFMEALASLYADKHGVRGFGIRIGHCSAQPTDARMLSHWIHPEDLADLVRVGLQAPYHHEIVYGASANSRSWWDNSRAHALGYAPRHSADGHAERLSGQVSADPVAEQFQGGSFAAAEFDREIERPILHP